MRRIERLQTLLNRLRDGRLHRGTDLARRLGVSQRTVYRDVDALRASGVPVEGERGTGFRLTAQAPLPPLNLSHTELEALHLGLAVVAEAADAELRAAARSLADRIDAALPDGAPASAPPRPGLAVYPLVGDGAGYRHLPALRAAIRSRQKLRLRVAGHVRTIRPLALEFRGGAWTLTAWCETDGAFRAIRSDRIAGLDILPELFVDEPGRTIDDYHDRA